MLVPWEDPRCIVCTREKPLSDEHIIPSAIGGVLQCRFLCVDCNSNLGKYEAGLKKETSIRYAMEALKTTLPSLYTSFSKGQSFVGLSEDRRAQGYLNNDAFRVRRTTLDDGSLILPTDEAGANLHARLKRSGQDVDLEELQGEIDAGPLGQRFVVGGYEVAKWPIDEVHPEFDGGLLTTPPGPDGDEQLRGAGVCLLKIAYEYIAVIVREKVFLAWFDPIRLALETNKPTESGAYRVETKVVRGRAAGPMHGIVFRPYQDTVRIEIRLFGNLAYLVHFPNLFLPPGAKLVIYEHDLLTGEDEFFFKETVAAPSEHEPRKAD